MNINQIKWRNAANGYHFFEHSTIRFFQSRILPTVYNGRYFITSEQPPYGPRTYTIRRAEDTGNINTIGEFGGYATAEAARAIAKTLLPEYVSCVWCDASTLNPNKVCDTCHNRDNKE